MSASDWFKRLTARGIDLLRWVERLLETLYTKLITERRWFAIVSTSASDFWKKKLYYYTGYFTYNAFLAALALIVALSALVGMILSSHPDLSKDISDAIKGVMPMLGAAPNASASTEAVNKMVEYRNVIGLIGFIGLLWTGSKIFGAMEWGFCQIWDSERRGYARRKLLGFLLVTVIGVLFITALVVQFAFVAFWRWLVGSESVAFTIGSTLIRPVVALAVNFLMFLFIYRFVPTVRNRIRYVALGALVGAAFFLGLQYLLGVYFHYLSKIPSTYGPISTVIVLILWLHITGMILFFGAEIVRVSGDRALVDDFRSKAKPPRLFKSISEGFEEASDFLKGEGGSGG